MSYKANREPITKEVAEKFPYLSPDAQSELVEELAQVQENMYSALEIAYGVKPEYSDVQQHMENDRASKSENDLDA